MVGWKERDIKMGLLATSLRKRQKRQQPTGIVRKCLKYSYGSSLVFDLLLCMKIFTFSAV